MSECKELLEMRVVFSLDGPHKIRLSTPVHYCLDCHIVVCTGCRLVVVVDSRLVVVVDSQRHVWMDPVHGGSCEWWFWNGGGFGIDWVWKNECGWLIGHGLWGVGAHRGGFCIPVLWSGCVAVNLILRQRVKWLDSCQFTMFMVSCDWLVVIG